MSLKTCNSNNCILYIYVLHFLKYEVCGVLFQLVQTFFLLSLPGNDCKNTLKILIWWVPQSSSDSTNNLVKQTCSKGVLMTYHAASPRRLYQETEKQFLMCGSVPLYLPEMKTRQNLTRPWSNITKQMGMSFGQLLATGWCHLIALKRTLKYEETVLTTLQMHKWTLNIQMYLDVPLGSTFNSSVYKEEPINTIIFDNLLKYCVRKHAYHLKEGSDFSD